MEMANYVSLSHWGLFDISAYLEALKADLQRLTSFEIHGKNYSMLTSDLGSYDAKYLHG